MQGQTKSVSFDGREIKLTTGRFAPQAGGSVMIECGDTSVLVTATKSTGREGVDFLPLMCDYEERLYAAGRIPGKLFEMLRTGKNILVLGPDDGDVKSIVEMEKRCSFFKQLKHLKFGTALK